MTIDNRTALKKSVELAQAYIDGPLTPIEAGSAIIEYVNPWRPCWDALGGAHGALSALSLAQEHAHLLHFLGGDVERWHPNVRMAKHLELAETEAALTPRVDETCRALIAYAANEDR